MRIPIALPALALALAASAPLPAAPKNVILFIGDGMGPEQVKAARYYKGAPLSFELLPYQAMCTTNSASSSVTDSAAAATAIATGVKVDNGVISQVSAEDGTPLLTLLEDAKTKGKETGLITTAYLTHATPAAFGAHAPSRSNYSNIAGDYLTDSKPNVLFGGGGNDLTVSATQTAGYTVVTDSDGFSTLDTSVSLLSAQFGSAYMPYEEDYLESTYPYPHLTDMVVKALEALEDDEDGFFLMVEAGRIDHACHSNWLPESVHETLALDAAVEAAVTWMGSSTDTLILVTSDHETGGLSVTADNGPGNYPTVSWGTTGHTGADVPVYAKGANASLVDEIEGTEGVLDNTDFFGICTADIVESPAATNPVPGDGSTEMPMDLLLAWTPGLGAASHNVYFGTLNPPPFIANTADPDYLPPLLTEGTIYYWKIEELDTGGTVIDGGTVWSFTTVRAPGPPTALDPGNGEIDVPVAIQLSWQPDPLSEEETVYLGTDAAGLVEVATTTAGAYDPPTSLAPLTTYWWQVESRNSAGTALSTLHSFTTAEIPPPDEITASAESSMVGNVVYGTFLDTHATENPPSYEMLEEVLNVSNKNGYSKLDHSWTFELDAALGTSFEVIAFHTVSQDTDDFEFSYSTDGVTYHPMLTVTKTTDTGSPQSFVFPPDVSGTVFVRATDTDHTKKNQFIDALWIDRMWIVASSGQVVMQYAATQPQPLDGAAGVVPGVGRELAWTPGADLDFVNGDTQTLHLSTDSDYLYDPDGNPDPNGTGLTGSSAIPSIELVPDTTYYWRIDAVDAYENLLDQGTVWMFQTGPDTSDVLSVSVAFDTIRADKGAERVAATVTVTNNIGEPIEGATVTGLFAIDITEVMDTTNASGVAVLESTNSDKKPLLEFTTLEATATGFSPYVYPTP